ncbi:MAG TPA: nucleoside diphosphate kinase regulator [Candidatus Aminicenantes bacterium]|nr:nucleoside diphosphate kinase regulator [Candidatus Aminicenantes bacterium]HDT13891.1 nucleoside diphosphate kinase regulator [Candidatus Aminicenantes bacterium]
MAKREIVITSLDEKRLTAVLNSPAIQRGPDRERLAELRAELERAAIVEPGEVPADVITMNSQVRVRDKATGETHDYTLVYPHEADITRGRISVLAPIGTALLGYRAGDVIEWQVPSGTRILEVESVLYQPESAGDLNT